MKVAMVSEHASPLAALGDVDAGGQNVHVAEVATHLARTGHEVTVFTRRDDPALATHVPLAERVTVCHLDAGPPQAIPKDELPPVMPAFTSELTRQLLHVRPDVLHTHFWMSGAAGLSAAHHIGIPVVHTYHALGAVKRRHQGANDPSPKERIRVEEHIARSVDRVVASCRDEVAELEAMGAPTDHLRVVPSGVDVDRFHPAGPAEPRQPGWRRVVVIGRLVQRKGIDDALQAVAAHPRTELVVAGGPARAELDEQPEVRRLRGVAAELGVADRLHLLGSISRARVPALLRSADVVACAPWYEPFGIVPLEAMACGIPVLATAVGGMLDTVVDGVTGLLVPPRDPARLTAALGALLDDPGWRARMGRAGAQRARARYAWEVVADRTAEVYAEVATTLPRAQAVGQ